MVPRLTPSGLPGWLTLPSPPHTPSLPHHPLSPALTFTTISAWSCLLPASIPFALNTVHSLPKAAVEHRLGGFITFLPLEAGVSDLGPGRAMLPLNPSQSSQRLVAGWPRLLGLHLRQHGLHSFLTRCSLCASPFLHRVQYALNSLQVHPWRSHSGVLGVHVVLGRRHPLPHYSGASELPWDPVAWPCCCYCFTRSCFTHTASSAENSLYSPSSARHGCHPSFRT